MTRKEIHAELEKLSTEFKAKISESLKLGEAVVQLKSIEFTIEQEKRDKNQVEALTHDNNTFTLKCRINSQGQIVCE